MLVPTTVPSIAASLEPLVANDVRDHPMLVEEIGVQVRAIARIAVLGLEESGTDRSFDSSEWHDRLGQNLVGVDLEHPWYLRKGRRTTRTCVHVPWL